MATGWQWRVRAALALSVLVLVFAACEPSGGDDGGGGSSSGGTGSESSQAAAGEKTGDKETKTGPNFGGGDVAYMKVAQDKDSLTAQQAADLVLDAGLKFGDDTQQDPQYVRCTGTGESGSGDEAAFDALDCYVEVPGVVPYKITVTVPEAGKAKAEFAGVAK
jgi:hypothetical protein